MTDCVKGMCSVKSGGKEVTNYVKQRNVRDGRMFSPYLLNAFTDHVISIGNVHATTIRNINPMTVSRQLSCWIVYS
jgi:hypothetical protein